MNGSSSSNSPDVQGSSRISQDDDARAIRDLWAGMARGWAAGDAAAFAAVFAEDCDFTTVRGDKPPGRAGVEAGHRALFEGQYAGTVLDARVVTVRFPHPDLAVVEAESSISSAEGELLAATHASAVVERTAAGRWTVSVFHNMIPAARPSAPSPSPVLKESPVTTPDARPKLRHLAIVARDPEKLAEFYSSVFAMELFHRDPDGSCFLSDGYLSLALIKHQLDGDTPVGMNHFGFHIEDTAVISEALTDAGTPKPAERFTNRPFAEYRAMDPEGNWFDLSEHGFGGPRPKDS